jgi:small GTP-binding protein
MQSFNINLLGDAGVGKTSLIRRITVNTFVPRYISSVGYNISTVVVNTNYGPVTLNLHDYAGQEKYSDAYNVHKSDASILMFDLANNISHNNLKFWYSKCDTSSVFVIGNKCDIREIKVVPTFHEKHTLQYLAVSAKKMSINALLTPILRRLLNHDDLVITA